jgi:hypothetical protein
MKASFALPLLLAFGSAVTAARLKGNPLSQVLKLMDELDAKIVKDGEDEAKAYKDFFQWCDTASKNVNYEIKRAKKNGAKLRAKIDELASNAEVSDAKIEELSGAIAQGQGELESAASIRAKEADAFATSEKELMDTVDTLERAISILEAEMSKHAGSFAQIDTSTMASLIQSMTLVVDAAGFNGHDQQKLAALLQEQDTADDEDRESGAPAAAKYESKSGNIVEMLEDLKDKSETELAEARKAESAGKHHYDMLKQSLEDQMKADTKDMNEEKAAKAAAEQEKATAQGDLTIAAEELKEAEKSLKVVNSDCMTTAADHEATEYSRKEELKVLREAKTVLQGSTSGAESQTYSFVQVTASSRMMSKQDLANSEVVTLVKKLARDHHSAALAQLASRIAVMVRYRGKGHADPFVKIKNLISEMITKLEKEARSEADEKAYCDEQMAKTESQKAELDDSLAKLTSKIDQAASHSASLKEEVTDLQSDLAKLAKTQAELDKIREEEHAAYLEAKADLEQGLSGVRKALDVLRDYYGGEESMLQQGDTQQVSFMQQPAPPEQHEKSSGAGGSIVELLSVVESDFANNLAKEESLEADSAEGYEHVTQDNKLAKAGKSQDVKHKTKEIAALEKDIAELSSDRDGSSTELAAVVEYYARVKQRCVAPPLSYEERKQRREAEIAGLKEALTVLENDAALVQVSSRARRGQKAHFMDKA